MDYSFYPDVAICAVMLSVILSFWGWLAVQVIKQGRKLVELEQRVKAQDLRCTERLEWMRQMDIKLSQTSEGVAQLVGALLPVAKSSATHLQNHVLPSAQKS